MLRGGHVARATLYLAVLVSTACSRALTGVKVRSVVLVIGTAAGAKRVAFGPEYERLFSRDRLRAMALVCGSAPLLW